ncbi:hypothetical protein AJ79_04093 [Helicocarpus griseus UAMH5409]|uniref:Uncharacterized protein n=1 Tax=Helicocarpus griseus UAMH5409 TaxID=1447875 RepID=A0A2B7XVS7_9EURO|nr:hypothetical protein AJ79_04093 [Helicocarpus griseus UAMH5409]
MSLKAVYERFLADPSPASLAPDAALHYIISTSSFSTQELIVKHLTTQHSRVVRKKSEKIVNAVEGAHSLCLDVDTSLEFLSGGGAYLLALDDNFLVDRIVTLPIIHIVHFDSQDKITQIRLYWDQGSLLKQLDVIGSSHRNWPIRDAADQSRLINSSVSAAARSSTAISSPASQADKRSVTTSASNASFASPSKKFGRDPHASLSLFEPHSPPPEERPMSVTSRSSAKPPPRDLSELFVGDDDDESTPTKAPQSPRKAPKAGAGHSYKPSRLFMEDDEEEQKAEQEKTRTPFKPTNAKKYNHFEFGETPHPGSTAKPNAPSHFEFGESEPPVSKPKQDKVKQASHFEFGEAPFDAGQQNIPMRPRSEKHLSQWDFEDFVTPEKPRQKVGANNVRHFGWSDDENEGPDSPPKPRAPQPRRDAESHFELRDDGTPGPQKHKMPTRGPGVAHNKGLGLYDNNLYDDFGVPVKGDEELLSGKGGPLGNVSNGVQRKKHFDSHWAMTDAGLGEDVGDKEIEDKNRTDNNENNNKHAAVGNDRKKAVKMMDSSWDTFAEGGEEEERVREEVARRNAPPVGGKRISRNVNQRSWGFGDDDM